MKKKKKLLHGRYILENNNGFYIFDTRLKRGRVFIPGKKVVEFSFQTHPKIVKSIIKQGKRCVSTNYKDEV